MDLKKAWQLYAVTRPLPIVISLTILVLVSIGWNLRNYRLEQNRDAQTKRTERNRQAAVALAKEDAERAELKRRAKYAQSDARIQRLYNEINHLTQVSERFSLSDQAVHGMPPDTNHRDETKGAP